MLKTLIIQNYALIDAMEIDFSKGFSAITGETGAGKSILLGAISLILGNRADTSILKQENKKCVVEAHFDISNYKLNNFFSENNLEYDEQTIIRRTIAPSGKSRAFLNDEPVNLNILKILGKKLIDIHSQNQNILINSLDFQFKIVNSIAGIEPQLSNYLLIYKEYKEAEKELNELTVNFARQQENYDYNLHRYKLLEEAKLDQENLEKLEQKQQQLSNSEEIKLSLSQAFHLLSGAEEVSILAQTKEALQHLSRISPYFPMAKELSERIESARIELNDIANILSVESESVNFESAGLEQINQRIDLLYSLLQNFKASNIAELIEKRDDLRQKTDSVENFDEVIKEKKQKLVEIEQKLKKAATLISNLRQKSAPKIEDYVVELLNYLGMPNAQLKIEVREANNYTIHGHDDLTFQFSANKNTGLQEITKVASGGEVSRLMLTIKSLLASYIELPTIIFDEIDTGISGDIANKMGQIMHEMGKEMQVISITHLPQVAAQGDVHYLVYKFDTEEGTYSKIKKLTKKERIEELAKMLSGETLSKAALANAKELLK